MNRRNRRVGTGGSGCVARGRLTYFAGLAWDPGPRVADSAAWECEVQGLLASAAQPLLATVNAHAAATP